MAIKNKFTPTPQKKEFERFKSLEVGGRNNILGQNSFVHGDNNVDRGGSNYIVGNGNNIGGQGNTLLNCNSVFLDNLCSGITVTNCTNINVYNTQATNISNCNSCDVSAVTLSNLNNLKDTTINNTSFSQVNNISGTTVQNTTRSIVGNIFLSASTGNTVSYSSSTQTFYDTNYNAIIGQLNETTGTTYNLIVGYENDVYRTSNPTGYSVTNNIISSNNSEIFDTRSSLIGGIYNRVGNVSYSYVNGFYNTLEERVTLSHVVGSYNSLSGFNSSGFIIGTNNDFQSTYLCSAIGFANKVNSQLLFINGEYNTGHSCTYGIVNGDNNYLSGNSYTHVNGSNNSITNSSNSATFGNDNIINNLDNVTIIGNDISATTSNALYSNDIVNVVPSHSGGTENYKIHKRIFPIGGWDMTIDTGGGAAGKTIYFNGAGISFSKIINVNVLIKNDSSTAYPVEGYMTYTSPPPQFLAQCHWVLNSTNVYIQSILSGFFDSTSFNDATINRGWVTIEYFE